MQHEKKSNSSYFVYSYISTDMSRDDLVAI